MTAYIFDSETTGMIEPEVVQTAWLKMGHQPSDPPVDRLIQHFKPSKPIELGALATHHIVEEELVDCPPSASFSLPSDCIYLIGHNVDFDWKAIGSPSVKRICTLALARSFWPQLDSHSQGALIYHFHRDQAKGLLRDAHNAMQDMENCYLVLQHILKATFSTVTSWEGLWKVSELARVPKTLTFGKHKGMAFRDVPRQYLQWILRQEDMDEFVKQAAKGAL